VSFYRIHAVASGFLLIAACGSDPVAPADGDAACADCDDVASAEDSASSDDAPAPVDTPTGDLPAPDSPPTPVDACAVEALLETACASCHAAEPLYGSPMPLLSVADLLAPSVTDPARRVVDLSVERVVDDTSPMPPSPNPMLRETEVALLRAVATSAAVAPCDTLPDAGTDAGPEPDADEPADHDVADELDEGAADAAADVVADTDRDAGADATTDTPRDTTGDAAPDVAADVVADIVADVAADAAVDAPFDPSECEWTIEMRANAGPDGGEFTVPNSSNHYECFYFAPTWTGDAHGLRFRSIIDDARVVHHWLLYAEAGAGTPGTHRGCSGSHENATLVAGWAPGGDDWVMPPNVGLEMPGDTTYFIEIHYANPRRLSTTDSSGVEICGTSTLREHTAGTHWLGTETILLAGAGDHRTTGTCNPNLTEPAHILRSWPHMHRYGRRMESYILRRDGARELLLDEPFAFDNQISHDTPFVINPGDRIQTTCHYTTDTFLVTFGPNTEQEMCYNFVVAWPAGAFNTGGGIRGGSDNFCLR